MKLRLHRVISFQMLEKLPSNAHLEASVGHQTAPNGLLTASNTHLNTKTCLLNGASSYLFISHGLQ